MPAKQIKRLIVACDGTWVNSDNGFVRKSWMPWNHEVTLATPSNVTRICRALKQESADGIPQIVYYQGGLGSQDSFFNFLFGGFLGEGISENIREAYAFLCNNYSEGDEIYLVGFSRGAFTARSIGGLIASVGLLTKHGLGSFYPIFQDWEHQNDPKFEAELFTDSLPKGHPRYTPGDSTYFDYLRKQGLTRKTIPDIKAIGVWDTVGSLGIPTMKLFGIPIHTGSTLSYSFVNTEVAHNVEHAYQALALDEQRTPFQPTVWENPPKDSPGKLKLLKQTWFPGVHTTVGGGYKDSSISDITLAWMVTQLSRHLEFDPEYVPRQLEHNIKFYKDNSIPVRPYAMGLIQRSDKGFLNTMTGRSSRTPGVYHATDPKTGKQLPRVLYKTDEFIHPCVRYRIEQHGQGVVENVTDYSTKSEYATEALKDWEFLEGEKALKVVTGTEWEGYNVWINKDRTCYIVEEKLEEGSAEMALVTGWPGVKEQLEH